MDYKELNAITIKDHFPMSMIDELLDELGCASCECMCMKVLMMTRCKHTRLLQVKIQDQEKDKT